MKKIEWINRNHMKFESLHKTFNKKVDVISTGNVIGEVQYSMYIRPFSEVKCNGFISEKGHLQSFDLEGFTQRTPLYILNQVSELTKTDKNIFYCIFHWMGQKKIVHGWILTTSDYRNNKLIKKWYANNNYKSMNVIDEVIEYLTY